jgi:hypothetical protein
MPYGILMVIIIVVSSTGDIERLPDGSHKYKHRIIVKRDSVDLTKVLTAFPVINNETKELVAFVELKWEKDDYNRKRYRAK